MLQSIPTAISVLNSARLTAALQGAPALQTSSDNNSSMGSVAGTDTDTDTDADNKVPHVALNVTYSPFPLQTPTIGIGMFIAAQTQSLYVASGFTIVAGMVSSRVVLERELGVKSMQLMMGINRVMYWLSFFVYDYLLYLVPACLSLGILALINPAVCD